MTLVIAGERSGVGKTTITLALLASLQRRGLKVQSFKVGPDYIDPMFHHYVTGRPCRNLDPVLTSADYVEQCFTRHTYEVDCALVEGVMGLFDGVRNPETHEPNFASTAHIARLLDVPVLLVLDCSRLSGSIAAIAQGYRNFDSRIKLAGVILNRVGSDRHLEMLKDALEPLDLPILGVLRRQDDISIPDRHLGLVPTDELPQLNTLIDRLATLGDTCFNWEIILPQLKPSSLTPKPIQAKISKPKGKIAVARDRAFNFYYQDNLDLLQELGAELTFWSPLKERNLPEGVQGLYLGGGFPEVFAKELSENTAARHAVKAAILSGMPTYAECGGLMYLCDKIVDFEEQAWEMVGVLPTSAIMGSRLTLGYRKAVALSDNLLLNTGETVVGHEFHRSYISSASPTALFQSWHYHNGNEKNTSIEGWQQHQVYASYLHLHWGENPKIAQNFIELAHKYEKQSS